MTTAKFFRKWSPVVAAVIPIIINLIANVQETIASGPPLPAKGVAPELWNLVISGQKVLAGRALLVSATLAAFLYALTTLAWRSDEIFDIVRELPRSRITLLAGANEVLDHLSHEIRHAKRRIYLMYLRPSPAFDDITMEYWETTTRLFVAKKSGHLPIRRIASIDEPGKLDYLLENNSQLFRQGGKDIIRIEYQLRAFPYMRTKPLRVDVIDDTAFMFATYDSQIMVTDEKVVHGCLSYYQDLWDDLDAWTIMDTSRAEKLPPKQGRTEYGYSQDQLQVIAKVIKEILKDKPSKKTFALIEPHCALTWEDFASLADGSPAAKV